jgi:hypothetical protein
MIDYGNTRDLGLMVLEALKKCTSTTRRLVSAMERAESGPTRGPRTGDRPLPAGMTAWVSAEDVVHAVGCSRSKANEYLRAASGRTVGTGRLLRVPVDVWEAWARENLMGRLRHERRGAGRTSPCTGPSMSRRRDLGPVSKAVSKLPLIPLLAPAKRTSEHVRSSRAYRSSETR